VGSTILIEMRSIVGLVIVGFIIFWIWNNIISPPKYIGFYYPDVGDLTVFKQSPELDSLHDCRDWVDDMIGERTDDNYDYECGKNCKLGKLGDLYVCDETLE
jgi:hypothetical protein